MASRFPYIFLMATNDNKDKKNDFYTLFKEILDTQSLILKNQAEIKDAIAELKSAKPKQSADIWGSI